MVGEPHAGFFPSEPDANTAGQRPSTEDPTPVPSHPAATADAPARTKRRSPIPDVSVVEIIGYLAWCAGVFALSLTATLVIVHKAVALPRSAQLETHFLVVWGTTWGGSMLLLSILAGFLVFRRTTGWDVALTWPWLVGTAVGLGYVIGLSGQMDAGSKLCDAPANGSCDTAWGLGAILVSLVAGLLLGGTFIGALALRRLTSHLMRAGERDGTYA